MTPPSHLPRLAFAATLAVVCGGALLGRLARADEEVPLLAPPAPAVDADERALLRIRSDVSGGRPRPTDLIRATDLFFNRPLDAAAAVLASSERPRPDFEYLMGRVLDAKAQNAEAVAHYARALASLPPGSPLAAEVRTRLAHLRGLLSDERRRPAQCPADRAALFAVPDSRGVIHPERRPMLLVHGYNGSPLDLRRIVDRLRDSDEQIYLACYESRRRTVRENAEQIASMIEVLRRMRGGRPGDLVVVAHSLGGIVARVALNVLTLSPGHPLEAWESVRFVAVDSPWHGFAGPGDDGPGAAFYRAVSPFIPRGIAQMRARSALFVGNPAAADPIERAGLFGVDLPDNVRVDLVFAERGTGILSYRKGVLADLPRRLAAWFNHDDAAGPGAPEAAVLDDDPRVRNFWRALQSAADYGRFADELRDLAESGRLTEAAARDRLEAHFPTFAGDHTTVLDEQPGRPSFLEHLVSTLREAPGGAG